MVSPECIEEKGKYNGNRRRGDKAKADAEEKIKECPECGSKNLVRDYGKAELFCADCGLVIAENIVDLGPNGEPLIPSRRQKGLGLEHR